jgi:1-acyl-sn-glycerol-3-phosphate acyltransferase
MPDVELKPQVGNWKRLHLPRVTVRYGDPFRFAVTPQSTREQQQEAADYNLERIRELHTELQRLGHKGALRAARRRGALAADDAPA